MQPLFSGNLRLSFGQFYKDATYFLNVIIFPDNVLIAQQISKSKPRRLLLRLGAGVKGTILRAQLLG
jgi:hypothetical protein